MIPRLLTLLDVYPATSDAFASHAASVPLWVFLKWVPQMTALIGQPEGRVVLPLLDVLAVAYPEALRYPFNISCEQIELQLEQLPPLAEAIRQKVRSCLQYCLSYTFP